MRFQRVTAIAQAMLGATFGRIPLSEQAVAHVQYGLRDFHGINDQEWEAYALRHLGITYLNHEVLVFDLAPRFRARQSGIIGGRSDLDTEFSQHGTDRLDSEPVLIVRDERYERGSRGSSSLAKKADAAFRISFARRNSATSRRNRFSSADSSLDGPGRAPASTSACRTHRRNASADTFTFAATDRIASHCDPYSLTCSNTNATARSRNSRE